MMKYIISQLKHATKFTIQSADNQEQIAEINCNYSKSEFELRISGKTRYKMMQPKWQSSEMKILDENNLDIGNMVRKGFFSLRFPIEFQGKKFEGKVVNEPLVTFKIFENENPIFKIGIGTEKGMAIPSIEVLKDGYSMNQELLFILIGWSVIGASIQSDSGFLMLVM